MPIDSIPNSIAPQFSIIIAVYNDWGPLEKCLLSIKQQSFRDCEIVVVDDGSSQPLPDFIPLGANGISISLIRQDHTGIASARNRGVENSRGNVLIFTDADCRFQPNCLAALSAAIAGHPQYDCFQLHLVGDRSNTLGRAEELRLSVFQSLMLQSDGCIRYLNTSGFAIRRSHVVAHLGPFDPAAQRAEDTLLLANLMELGQLPFFARDAIVQHTISMSLTEILRKDVRSAWLEGSTFEIIRAKGIRIRMRNRERLLMLACMWRKSQDPSIGRLSWFVLVIRQFVERTVSLLYMASARLGGRKRSLRRI